MVKDLRSARVSPQFAHVLSRRFLARVLVSTGLAGVFLWLLSQRLSHIDWADVQAGFAGVSLLQGFAALGSTAISFWAIGNYDAVLHRHFATGLPDRVTRKAGICAIAVGQTVGFGLITGAILRWRLLPEHSLLQATRFTAGVAISFLAGWAVVTAAALAVLPDAPFKPAAAAVLIIATAFCTLCLLGRPFPGRLPNGFTLFRLLGLCALDTLAAAFAFYLLCPDALTLSFVHLLPAFLLAFGAGLISGTPGGVGAFEITLLTLLPTYPAPALLTAILAWRVIYYALPALMAAVVVIRGPKNTVNAHPVAERPVPPAAQAGLVHQGEHSLTTIQNQTVLCARTAHFLIAMFDTGQSSPCTQLHNFRRMAQAESRLPVFYHLSARSAILARKSGFSLLRIAQEAWIAPANYDLGERSRSGLRRKLRRATAAGTIVTTPWTHGPIPWRDLDEIAHSWVDEHGAERGFSMGRYARQYLSHQRLYIAWAKGKPIAFVTFHQAAGDWALDLMRHGPELPDGVMHLLIQSAIDDAASMGIGRLSLAAVPTIGAAKGHGLLHRLIATATRGHSGGLVQFKSSFAPQWRTVYLAAPSRGALLWACGEIARSVFLPQPLPAQSDNPQKGAPAPQEEEYEFASARGTWHRKAE